MTTKPVPDIVLRSMRYRLTVPVDAVQLKSICDEDVGFALRPVGVPGTAWLVVADASFE
jgi:hypothetical protein